MHIKVIAADDHPVVLAGVRKVLGRHDDIMLVGEASDSTGVVSLLSNVPCDVLVTDYEMPNGEYGDGLPYLTLLRNCFPNLKIVVFTMSNIRGVTDALAQTGQFSFLHKTAGVGELVSAVREAAAGRAGSSEKISEGP